MTITIFSHYYNNPLRLEHALTPPARTAAALKARRWDPVCPDTGAALTAVPTREDDRTAPSSVYAATKLMQEDLVRITCDTAGLGYAIFRLQNVYGEGQSLPEDQLDNANAELARRKMMG